MLSLAELDDGRVCLVAKVVHVSSPAWTTPSGGPSLCIRLPHHSPPLPSKLIVLLGGVGPFRDCVWSQKLENVSRRCVKTIGESVGFSQRIKLTLPPQTPSVYPGAPGYSL